MFNNTLSKLAHFTILEKILQLLNNLSLKLTYLTTRNIFDNLALIFTTLQLKINSIN
jgi:hypothetical protein